MTDLELTQAQARRFLLAYQGLWPPYASRGKVGILDYIRRVGCIQYDPLNIVGHNPELALQARLADFRPDLLRQLLYEDRQLLDGFDKNMAIYRLDDWPYFRRRRAAARDRFHRDATPVRAILPQVRAALEARGPLSALDLDLGPSVEWDWGTPSSLGRAALESMYFWGELVIHHKVHTRKVYDFAHRQLPFELLQAPEPNPTEEGYHDWYVLRRIGGVGLLWNRAGEAWLGMSSIKSQARRAALERLLAAGGIRQSRLAGFSEPFYLRARDEACLVRILEMPDPPPQAVVMAPLDNLLWDRRLLKDLFDFDYRWEVYVPQEKRRYGYYVLPVLYGDRFMARFEPGREKGSRALVIKNWWWEAGISPDSEMRAALADCLEHFLNYLGTDCLLMDGEKIGRSGLPRLVDRLAAGLPTS